MRKLCIKRQNGVFAIEFALGFIVLFMFTMLIFETCRVTYISAVLDYATAEAARDARVQLEKNKELSNYINQDCEKKYENEPQKKKTCLTVNSFNGDQFQIWFYWFVERNGGVLWQVLTSASDMNVTVKHYKDLNNLMLNKPQGTGSNKWRKNAFTVFEINYSYRPVFFHWSTFSTVIKRHALVIDEFERHNHAKN